MKTEKDEKEEKKTMIEEVLLEPCICCNQPSKFSIWLAHDGSENPRYYLPNQHVRANIGTIFHRIYSVPFCHACMRTIEDNLRETIDTLKTYKKTEI